MADELVAGAEGADMAIPGATESTVKVLDGLGASDKFPAASIAVFAAIEIPNVPFPVMPEIVTTLVVDPVPVTLTTPSAVPVLFNVIFALASEIDETPA